MSLAEGRAAKGRFYRPELDRVRFFVFLSVFVAHLLPGDDTALARMAGKLSMPPWFRDPTFADVLTTTARTLANGVTISFVLSSYLITTLLIKERNETGQIRIWDFYVRRALRIWPLYFVYLAVAFAFGAFDRHDILWFAVFLGNWHLFLHSTGSVTGALGLFWSVCVEEQFYLVWPHLLRRASLRRFLPIAGAFLVASNAMRIHYVLSLEGRPSEELLWYNTLTQIDPFVSGTLIAFVCYDRPLRWSALRRHLVTLAGVGAFVWCGRYGGMVRDSSSSALTLLAYPLSTLGASLILLGAISAPASASSDKRGVWPWLGRRCYGLYALHAAGIRAARWLVFSGLALHLTGTPLFFLLAALGLAFTFAIATASYRFLEEPFLRLKGRFTHVKSRPGG